jgi:hypothetical protein
MNRFKNGLAIEGQRFAIDAIPSVALGCASRLNNKPN